MPAGQANGARVSLGAARWRLAEAPGQDWESVLERLVPWAELVVEGILGAQLPLQFAKRLLSGWVHGHDPQRLGYVACTIAYQRSIQQAIPAVLGSAPPAAGRVRSQLRAQMLVEATCSSFGKFPTVVLSHQSAPAADRPRDLQGRKGPRRRLSTPAQRHVLGAYLAPDAAAHRRGDDRPAV